MVVSYQFLIVGIMCGWIDVGFWKADMSFFLEAALNKRESRRFWEHILVKYCYQKR